MHILALLSFGSNQILFTVRKRNQNRQKLCSHTLRSCFKCAELRAAFGLRVAIYLVIHFGKSQESG